MWLNRTHTYSYAPLWYWHKILHCCVRVQWTPLLINIFWDTSLIPNVLLKERDWSRSAGSYGNNIGAICCSVQGRPAAQLEGHPTINHGAVAAVIRNQPWSVSIKLLCIEHLYNNINSQSQPNRPSSLNCLRCNATHLSLTTGVVRHAKWFGQFM